MNGKAQGSSSLRWDWILLGLVAGAAGALIILNREPGRAAFAASRGLLREMMTILPAVTILIGLLSVWLPKEAVTKYLGKASGVKGIAVALLLGALPTGPLYIAFPLVAALMKMGASVSNMVVFLTAWACISIPQEIMELQFLGFKFMAARLALTVVAATMMGLVMGKLVGQHPERPEEIEDNVPQDDGKRPHTE